MMTPLNSPFPVAQYTPSRIPHFRGNPLIEALPPTLDEEELFKGLIRLPEFEPEQRTWNKTERQHMIGQLSSFLLPLPRHASLAAALDTLMRTGYVGRTPLSPASNHVYEKLHASQQAGQHLGTAGTAGTAVLTAQLSASLIGTPGAGKTTAIKHILARYPLVIYHPELQIYQVPWLHVETPYDGASVKGIAESIFRKMDKILPDANYRAQYVRAGAGAETLMNNAARVLHMHSVGLLVVDEIQNLENAPRNRQSLMTLLVSASNELGVPLVFVGTNKAQNILAQDFRQARRSSGLVSPFWGPLEEGEGWEWEIFIQRIWHYQWVKNPVELTPALSKLMFFHTQGIPDLVIKLFAIAQVRAMQDESETLTGELLEQVVKTDLALVQPMVQALRNKDMGAFETYRDIAPIGLDTMLSQARAAYSGRQVIGKTITNQSPVFTDTVTSTLTTLGFDEGQAKTLAEQVADSPNAIKGVIKALSHAESGKTVKKRTAAGEAQVLPSYPPGDLRNGLNPILEGDTVLDRLKALGLVTDIDSFLAP